MQPYSTIQPIDAYNPSKAGIGRAIGQWLAIATLVFLVSAVTFFTLGKPLIGIDDANIFFSYAKNVAGGHGFVYNAGGERVEGFTSFLWVIVCAAAYYVSASPEILLLLVSFILTCCTLNVAYNELKKDFAVSGKTGTLSRYHAVLPLLFFIAIGASYVAWSVLSLMENVLWNFLFVYLVILTLRIIATEKFGTRGKITFVVLLSLLILTRPEGIAWSILFILSIAVTLWRKKQKLYFPLLLIVVFGLVLALFTFFRLKYFGYPLPNTYYAKVSGNLLYNIKEGVAYVLAFLSRYNALVTLLLCILVVSAFNYTIYQRKRSNNAPAQLLQERLLFITFIILAALGLPMISGGDHFANFRFYQGILLLFAWGIPALIWLISFLKEHPERQLKVITATAGLFCVMIGLNSLMSLSARQHTQMKTEFDIPGEGRALASAINNVFEQKGQSKPSTGVITTGGFGLGYKGMTIDLMGLNNVAMGHSKGDRKGIKNHAAFNKEIFYQLNPTLLMPQLTASEKTASLRYNELIEPGNFDNQAMKNIFNDTLFKNTYQPVAIGYEGKFVFCFARRTYVDSIKNSINPIIIPETSTNQTP